MILILCFVNRNSWSASIWLLIKLKSNYVVASLLLPPKVDYEMSTHDQFVQISSITISKYLRYDTSIMFIQTSERPQISSTLTLFSSVFPFFLVVYVHHS